MKRGKPSGKFCSPAQIPIDRCIADRQAYISSPTCQLRWNWASRNRSLRTPDFDFGAYGSTTSMRYGSRSFFPFGPIEALRGHAKSEPLRRHPEALDAAKLNNWTVVPMKDDRKRIFKCSSQVTCPQGDAKMSATYPGERT